ncbi:hypothetical protein [Mycobacteroides abscessus]|uniref:hypothetical protein n=1 Tax=Mycobacteroides abscessus TaxID=36809 RepID=UPI001F210EFE|nr:hypothetical protein [Mycobacteroides abscessus]
MESDPPDYTQAALRMGDFIHNLRASMDHAIWAATPAAVQEATPTSVAFPLFGNKESYEKWVERRKEWYGTALFEVLRSSQPFNAAGTNKLHPLHILQFLSNNDKHRLLNIVANNQVGLGGVRVVPEPPGGVRSKVTTGLVQRGSVLARVEFERPAARGSVDLNPVFAYEQVLRYVDQDHLEHWLPVGEAMNVIGPAVVEAVGLVISAHAKDSEQ